MGLLLMWNGIESSFEKNVLLDFTSGGYSD